jgi:hypothetical protein
VPPDSVRPIVAKRADRAGFPLLGCIETLYLRVSLIILDENIPTICCYIRKIRFLRMRRFASTSRLFGQTGSKLSRSVVVTNNFS